ncbi:MAG: DNA-directed DNA polymerase II small subunit [Methanophagales archaeon ANME-1-THS]|nr:MAG: DNA-directed DNA polymerase II small subunit [Methanophagales archaeon ANME-1-THS]
MVVREPFLKRSVEERMVVRNESERRGSLKELEIVKRFADFGFQVQPEALELLSHYSSTCDREGDFNIGELAECVTKSVDPSIFVISPELIADIIKKKDVRSAEKVTSVVEQQPQVDAPAILKSFPEHGKAADQKDFLPHFIDRYERLSGIIKKRLKCGQIRFIKSGSANEEISVVGMVSSVAKTAKGNIRVELEDTSGSLSVIVPHKEEIIPDEIIGVTGFLSSGRQLIAERIIYPDVPIPTATSQSALPLSDKEQQRRATHAVFISDLHFGSTTFLDGAWDRFVQWMNEESSRLEIAYLVVAGDIVDGIGVYPGQEEDLSITDIEAQYKMAAGSISDLPSHLHIILAPGNHDAVRSAEPQPPLPEKIQKFFPEHTCFVSNPAYIRIGGRQVLIYHGQSYDDFVNVVSRLSYAKPEDVMIEMLRRRHLAPLYGNNVSILPDGHDYGVIDPVPEIFQCGHTHTVGISKYRNVLLINAGTWQAQTPYQKKRGINPVTGCATLVDLSELKVKVLDFGGRSGA